ncbi:hypothetical protein Lgee_1957 [Legionella geestiana]|uniref:Uncharacterized protein n=1 Tax=Legionella geestiana TaxID=45065 RepID=A0A0W0TNX4_9GAMM|nr:hypothetical protein [Legionella geestiana]KTC97296.1 hypothetical protein Lgee_1957 [Legionella geestiana]QBS12424.1 hypothetical protein E4T54_06500 [Legionella geestiana]QDQ39862.1 hypothetical protein E3226_005360 [Legionella geestiana]STX55135.1 Uncharacterised protein [Legionella geestiana]
MKERQEEPRVPTPSTVLTEEAAGWGSAAFNNALARNFAAGSAAYTWRTLTWMTRQGGASMEALYHAATHKNMRELADNLRRLVVEWSPIVGANVTVSLLEAWGNNYLVPMTDGLFPGAPLLLSGAFFLPGVAVTAWSFNRIMEFNLHAAVVASKTPGVTQSLRLRVPFKTCENPFDYDVSVVHEEGLPETLEPYKLYLRLINGKLAYSVITPKGEPVRDRLLSNMPVPEPFMKATVVPLLGAIFEATAKRGHTLPGAACGGMRRLKGSLIMEPARYWASELGLRLVGYVFPSMTIPVGILRLFHNGRFLLGESLPELCYRHKDTYYQEHPELTLSLGLAHFLTALGLAWCLSTLPTLMFAMMGIAGPEISPLHFLSGLQQIMLVVFVMIASHMTLPEPVKHSRRPFWLDPMNIWYTITGFEVDAHIHEGKKRIEALMKAPKDPDAITLEEVMQKTADITGSRPVQMVKKLLLPKAFHSMQNLIEDPFVREVWPEYRVEIIKRLCFVESIFASWTIQGLAWKPKQAAHVIAWIAGAKPNIVYAALKLAGSEKARLLLGDIRRYVEGLVLRVDTVINAETSAPLAPAVLPEIPETLVPATLIAVAQAEENAPFHPAFTAPTPSSSSSSSSSSMPSVSPFSVGRLGFFGSEDPPLPSAAELQRALQASTSGQSGGLNPF